MGNPSCGVCVEGGRRGIQGSGLLNWMRGSVVRKPAPLLPFRVLSRAFPHFCSGIKMNPQAWISGHFLFLQKDKAAKANTAVSKASRKQRSGSVIGKYVDSREILGR